MSLDNVKHLLSEAKRLISENRIPEAVEALYSAVELLITNLSFVHGLDVSKRAEKLGRWSVEYLDEALEELADMYGSDHRFLELWDLVWELRLEKSPNIDTVRRGIELLEQVIDRVEHGPRRRRRGRGR